MKPIKLQSQTDSHKWFHLNLTSLQRGPSREAEIGAVLTLNDEISRFDNLTPTLNRTENQIFAKDSTDRYVNRIEDPKYKHDLTPTVADKNDRAKPYGKAVKESREKLKNKLGSLAFTSPYDEIKVKTFQFPPLIKNSRGRYTNLPSTKLSPRNLKSSLFPSDDESFNRNSITDAYYRGSSPKAKGSIFNNIYIRNRERNPASQLDVSLTDITRHSNVVLMSRVENDSSSNNLDTTTDAYLKEASLYSTNLDSLASFKKIKNEEQKDRILTRVFDGKEKKKLKAIKIRYKLKTEAGKVMGNQSPQLSPEEIKSMAKWTRVKRVIDSQIGKEKSLIDRKYSKMAIEKHTEEKRKMNTEIMSSDLLNGSLKKLTNLAYLENERSRSETNTSFSLQKNLLLKNMQNIRKNTMFRSRKLNSLIGEQSMKVLQDLTYS